jgi:hypothetical protein
MTAFPVRLESWMDAIGPLHGLQEQDGCLVAKIGPVLVALPYELNEELKDLIGQKIAILRTESDYRLRVIDGR